MVSAQHRAQGHKGVGVIVQTFVALDPRLSLPFCAEAKKCVAGTIAACDGYVEANSATAGAHDIFGHRHHMAHAGGRQEARKLLRTRGRTIPALSAPRPYHLGSLACRASPYAASPAFLCAPDVSSTGGWKFGKIIKVMALQASRTGVCRVRETRYRAQAY